MGALLGSPGKEDWGALTVGHGAKGLPGLCHPAASPGDWCQPPSSMRTHTENELLGAPHRRDLPLGSGSPWRSEHRSP